MIKIGLLSDTHGSVNEKIDLFFNNCDEIWHAGDWGNSSVSEHLKITKKVRGVYGNIDDHKIRLDYPEVNIFTIEGVKVLITHIGGYPGRYQPTVRQLIIQHKPQLFICGHSHILKIIFDKKYNVLHINPGAAGNSGFHTLITAIRFEIDNERIQNLEILEIPRKQKLS